MTQKQQQIAVVSMAGIFPGAEDTGRFLKNILDKHESVIPVPAHRWPAPVEKMVSKHPRPDRAVSDRAGLIPHFAFDPQGFKLAPDLLAGLDPVHQLVLQAGRAAAQACAMPSRLKKRTGVILAAIALPTDAASRISLELLCHKTPRGLTPADAVSASMVATPAAILANSMGFQGGSYTLDAACASSLYAIQLACDQLAFKKADIMVAGGVSRPDALYTQVGFTQLSALSPSGRCSPFDRDADGLVVGEGCGILVLKRLADAVACKDTIHAVIRGYGRSNDIDGNLVGPATEGQVRAMQAAYDMAGWTPADIQYMECHGSGTPVGDRVETVSIRDLLERYQCPDAPLAIGSVKSNIGHLLTAAGAAGFIKTVAAMKQGVLPPSLNFSAPPDNSPLNASRFNVQTRVEDWLPKAPGATRKAGISAFGFGGINAHVLVEAFHPEPPLHPVPDLPGAGATPVPARKHPGVGSSHNPEIVPIAVVGMETLTRDCPDLSAFNDLILGKTGPEPAAAGNRWQRTDFLPGSLKRMPASFMESLSVNIGEFHIPPNQMADILPQHLAMLKTAKGALADAGISPRPSDRAPLRTRMGCAVGIDFDFGAADFYLRWHHHRLPEDLLEQLGPPLTFNRTLGALGGIVASRMAREFQLGGPCFTLSAKAASGLKAVEIAMQSLGRGETDVFLCGCVDMAGDLRQFLLNHAHRPFGPARPAEGAGALVLKRLADAVRDKDRIYAIVQDVSIGPQTGLSGISLVETGSGGGGEPGAPETDLLQAIKEQNPTSDCAPGWAATRIGDTRTASGLFSVIETALALYQGESPAGSLPRKALVIARGADDAITCCKMTEPPVATKTRRAQGLPPRAISGGEGRHPIVLPTCRTRFSPGLIDAVRDAAVQGAALRDAVQEKKTDTGLQTSATPQPADSHALPGLVSDAADATARAHEAFLDLTRANMGHLETQFAALTRAAKAVANETFAPRPAVSSRQPAPLFSRKQCMEFAVGRAGKVLGPQFDIIDTYPVRVRLPDAPLMLVDRIIDIKGEPCSLGPGKIVTQHDVQPLAWYLDGGLAPVSISIEAGQADLFLCAYLGIDHAVKGKRKYRLLDAKVTFHRSLPRPGETIEYHIEIDRFLKQGEVYLFFFHYKGYIGSELLISMRDGCAGFFTEQEVENSGGIILKKEELQPVASKTGFRPLAPVSPCAFSDGQVGALRAGDLEAAFGPDFKGIRLGESQRLPGGRMHLIDRVLHFDPQGGRYGLGSITAEADIRPDHWFLTCHFIDDMVMPGTLMYECCAHALRIFVQRMGWVSPDRDVRYNVLPANESDLKCRGPVTRATQKARYEIDIKEMGYTPEPYCIADAHMFSDDHRIVLYKDMGMKLEGLTRETLTQFWRRS